MEEVLNRLLQKQFDYKGKLIVIKSWKKVNSIYVVICDKRTYNFYENEIVEFVNSLQAVSVKLKAGVLEKRQKELNQKNMENQKLEKAQEVKEPVNSYFDTTEPKKEEFDVKEVLYQAIRDVKANKGYIPQANAICNITTQIINLKKIDFLISSKKQ
jgi:uncharacterized radical SAM superfamily Fe-S cluster-containing enzyme